MLDPKEEKKFEELRNKCRDLKVPAPPEIMIGLKVHDKNGVLTFDDVQRGHSWTRNFWNNLFGTIADAAASGSNTFGAGYLSSKIPAGTIFYNALYCGCRGPNGAHTILGFGFHNNGANSTFGIVVGTGDTAFSVEQVVLVTQIAHGNSATQLAHNAMIAPVTAYTAGSKTWKNTATRIFNNNSGSSITVKECGLYSQPMSIGDTGGQRTLMIERSVLSPTVAVANGAQLTVTYEISMDFSAID
jgi:hypothetical protein